MNEPAYPKIEDAMFLGLWPLLRVRTSHKGKNIIDDVTKVARGAARGGLQADILATQRERER